MRRPSAGRALGAISSLAAGPTLACLMIALAVTVGSVTRAEPAQGASSAPLTAEPATGEGTNAPAPGDGEEAVDPAQRALDAQLLTGAGVYSQICAACHQPGGAGLPGQFPPLLDNPSVDDTGYVEDVIVNGLQGEIVVDGQAYNGVMPSFSTLSDDDVAAVITYIQNDFAAPQAAVEAFEASGPVAGTELPPLADMSAIVAFLLAAAVVGMVLAPRLTSVNDRLAVPWLDAWLKTAVIVLSVVFFTVVIPDWALKTSPVSKLSRFGQDLIGSGLWALGLAAVIGGLWYAHRESRI